MEVVDRLIQHGARIDLQKKVNYTNKSTAVQNTQRSITNNHTVHGCRRLLPILSINGRVYRN